MSRSSSRMPGNHVHGNRLLATFVPGRKNELDVKGIGPLMKVKKITRFSFPLLLKRKKYFTNPSCVPHWERKTSPRSTALVNRIGLQPFLCTHWYPALVPCSANAVEADFAVRPKARQYIRQVLKRTESLIVPKTSPTQALGCAGGAEDEIIGLKVWKSNARRRESFLATTRKIPWQSRKELHLQLALLAVECTAMVFNALQINSHVFSEEIGANAKKIRSVNERSTHWHLRSANSASITSLGHPVETSGCGHATFGFGSAPATAWTWWCILANKGFLILPIVTKFSPLPEQNDDLRFCLPCEKCEWWWGRRERAPVNFVKESFADEETCGNRYRIEHVGRWLDQGEAILADQPLCSLGDELNEQLSSLLSIFASSFSRSLQQRWLLRLGLARWALDVTIDEHAVRARPSCCGFWNLVNAHAWKFPQAYTYGPFLVTSSVLATSSHLHLNCFTQVTYKQIHWNASVVLNALRANRSHTRELALARIHTAQRPVSRQYWHGARWRIAEPGGKILLNSTPLCQVGFYVVDQPPTFWQVKPPPVLVSGPVTVLDGHVEAVLVALLDSALWFFGAGTHKLLHWPAVFDRQRLGVVLNVAVCLGRKIKIIQTADN